MISKSELKGSAAEAAGYYIAEQARAEYYSAESVPSAWRGSAAEALGLAGRVEARDLESVLAGRVIDATGARQLGTRRGGELQHRAGWDFTISAPKSVSLQALVFDDRAALEAHRRAVGEALSYLERHGAVFRPQSGVYKQGAGLAIATFEHVSSRARDPQLHTHALIANVTVDASTGRAYSLSNERLFEHRRAADAVYHAALARELERAGHQVRFDREGRVEMAAYDRASLRDFSTRAAEIEAALAARGLDRGSASAAQRDMLALTTRSTKDLPETRAAHAERWAAQAEALGVRPAEPQHGPAREREAVPEAEAAAQALTRATEHLTEREAVFSRAELHREALKFAEGRASIEAVESEISRREKDGALIRTDGGERSARFSTRQALEEERDTDRRLAAGRGAHLAVMSQKEFDQALAEFESRKGFALSQEQRAAARMVLTGNDRFQGVQGLAGTGKTTMLEFVREAAEAKGWTVRGHSNGAEQAAVMERESGIRSTTTAQHLIDERRERAEGAQQPAPARRELRIMDEAGMAGQRSFRDVVRSTEAAGARTVMLGDVRQHQSVERGRAFERAQAHMPTSELGRGSIRRQKTEHLKAAVSEILARREAQALARLDVREIAPERQAAASAGKDRLELRAAAVRDNAHVIRQIARDYAALPAPQRASTLVLTSTNDDRRAINAAIRAELQRSGALPADAAQARVLRASDMTKEEARRAASYKEGQVIEISTGRGRQARTERLQIEAADSRNNTLRCRDEAGRVREIDPAARGQRVQAYEAESRALAVGDRLRFTENHALPVGERVRNGQVAVVERIEGDRVHLRMGEGEHARRVLADVRALKADHDYAVTSYSAQGRTVDRVMVHHNTEAGRHSGREVYVNVTRAREHVVVYTQDVAKMERQAGVEVSKTAAHDVVIEREREAFVKEQQRLSDSPERQVQGLAQREQASQQAQRDRERGMDFGR